MEIKKLQDFAGTIYYSQRSTIKEEQFAEFFQTLIAGVDFTYYGDPN